MEGRVLEIAIGNQFPFNNFDIFERNDTWQ
jgi:hypothetical protein